MTTKSLPDVIAQAISDMQMPLSHESYLPMYYKSLPELARIRADAPDIPDFVRDVVGTIAMIRDDYAPDSVQEYLSRCAVALILLGHGGTDEAHDLVSPLSWPNELPFAYGPPVAVPEQVLSLASYVHALVHRREGPHPSEFGMTGFSNADYWAGSALRSPEGAEALPLDEIRSSIMALATSEDATIQQWVQHNVAEENAFPVWDPRVLNELCMNLQVAQKEGRQPQPSPALVHFAEQAVLAEMKILLKHTLKAIGYDL
jgi:hypothetical protein